MAQNNFYLQEQKRLSEADVYSLSKTIHLLQQIGYRKFLGKSGNRTCKKHDLQLYKSIMHHALELYGDKLKFRTFSVCITILGEYKGELKREHFCKCENWVNWRPAEQKIIEMGFCKSCFIPPGNKDYYRYKFKDNWKHHYTEYLNQDHVKESNQIRARKAIEVKIKRGITGFVNKGKNEKLILDAIEHQDNIIIDRDYKVSKYFPDGYCAQTNTIYEVYEKFHYYPAEIEKDEKRRKAIQKKLNCTFVVVKDTYTESYSEVNIENLDIKTYEPYNKE